MFSCTQLLQQTAAILQADTVFWQKLEANIVSMASVHFHAQRLASACYYRFVQHGVRNCESTFMQLWKCFTVSPLQWCYLAMHQTTMKTKGRQLQRACKARWLLSEATVRARIKLLAIQAALKQLTENKNDAMCVVLLRLMKKKFNMVLSFWQHCHHGRQKDFFHGGALGDFSKIFSGGAKVMKFVFLLSKLRKQPFLLKFSKSRGSWPPLPPSSDVHHQRQIQTRHFGEQSNRGAPKRFSLA